MRVQCQCGTFQAELTASPKNSPGRLVCYCDDCQMFMMQLGRTDLLCASGGTEIIPAYPADVRIVSGAEHLRCTQLSPKGMHRFSTTCCNSPVGNTSPGRAWLGIPRNMYTASDPQVLERTFGDIKARIMGKFAKGPTPPGTPAKMNLKAAIPVLPYIIKGALTRKGVPSPFFPDGKAIVPPKVLSEGERADLRKRWEAIRSYPLVAAQ